MTSRNAVFLYGPAAFRRTVAYLKDSKLQFRNRVKIMEIHYNIYKKNSKRNMAHIPFPQHDPHVGLREFYFWNIPQIQYTNPNVQIVRFVDRTPNPFIRCWLEDGKDVIFDCDSQNKETIVERLVKTLGKTPELIKNEEIEANRKNEHNSAIFGLDRERFCMCEVPGQCPCPGVIQLPKTLRGKYNYFRKEDYLNEEEEIISGKKELESFDLPLAAKITWTK